EHRRSVVDDRPIDDGGLLVGEQPHDGTGEHRLAAAALAHHAERLARGEVERYVLNRVQRTHGRREPDVQTANLEKDLRLSGHRALPFVSNRSRHRSPMTVNARTVKNITIPGISATWGCRASSF